MILDFTPDYGTLDRKRADRDVNLIYAVEEITVDWD